MAGSGNAGTGLLRVRLGGGSGTCSLSRQIKCWNRPRQPGWIRAISSPACEPQVEADEERLSASTCWNEPLFSSRNHRRLRKPSVPYSLSHVKCGSLCLRLAVVLNSRTAAAACSARPRARPRNAAQTVRRYARACHPVTSSITPGSSSAASAWICSAARSSARVGPTLRMAIGRPRSCARRASRKAE